MYSNRTTPVQRMRNGGVSPRQPATFATNNCPKRQPFESGSAFPIKKNGDYHVLRDNVIKERNSVQGARVSLANSLDQLGEHHVRQREYDDAMDAFTEALREKKSVFWNIAEPLNENDSSNVSRDKPSPTENCHEDTFHEHDKAIDEIVNTLRNIGNVHSLRGEQEEAMRYFSEVTNLRAQKKSTLSIDSLSGIGATESRSLLSGLNDDTSTLMSEINEDVKALDDLFRSITFRNQPTTGPHGANGKATAISPNGGGTEKRKSKQTSGSQSATTHLDGYQKYKRRKSNSSSSGVSNTVNESKSKAASANIVENEPFSRSTSNLHIPASGNEAIEALDIYRSILEDSYSGTYLDKHQELVNSLSLRAELLSEQKRQASESPRASSVVGESNQPFSKASDLELALEVYNHVLIAHEESSQNLKQQKQEQSTESSIPEEDDRESKVASMVASTLICMGSIYYKLGNRFEELQMYRDAKCVYKEAFGDRHVFVAGTLKNIGMVLAERGEYDEAMAQFSQAMDIYLSVNSGSEMNRDVASAISCMGNVKNRVGELDAALAQYMEALRIYKYLHANSTTAGTQKIEYKQVDDAAGALRDVTSTLKVIGMVHAKRGDLDTAMGFFQEAMSLLRTQDLKTTPTGREAMASVLTRIASIHLKKADLDKAMSHYREAYDLIVSSNQGTTNHPDVAGILHYIGGIYHKRAEYDEAMACYQEAIRIYHSTLGPGNPTVAGTLVMVGSIYYKRRNLDSAMMFYREALRLNRDAYGMHHPDVAPILKSIGTILTKKGEYREAFDIFRDVLRIKCTVHGTDHPEVAGAYKSLGNVHYKMGDLADAERQYRHALSIFRRTKGEEHADTLAAKTTIEHLRYWMREKEQRQLDQRSSRSSPRVRSSREDERSC